MTVLFGLLPALVLLGGALLYSVAVPIPRIWRWIPIATCSLAIVALIVVARAAEPTTLLPPNDALPSLSLTLDWNGIVLPFGIVLLVVLSGRLLFGLENDARSFVVGALITAGAALLFLAADNFTTVAAAWIFVELGLLVVPSEQGESRRAAAHALGWNLVAIVLWLTAAMVVTNTGSSLRLTEVALQDVPACLVLLAIWIRSGIYPFQVAAPADSTSVSVRIGIPFLLGGYLMTRFLMQAQGDMAFAAEMEILALLAVGASALVVVGQLHGSDALIWTVRSGGAALMLLPFFVAARVAPAVSVWFSLGMFVVCAALEIAMQWRSELPRLRLALFVWIGMLVMIGALPLAPTFWGRVGLLAAAYSQNGIMLWLLLVATMALVLVPVWREIFASSQVAPKAPTLTEYAALACVLFSALALVVAPMLFLVPFGSSVQAGGAYAYDALFKPASLPALLFLLAGLILPPLAAFELARRWAPRANLLPTHITDILDLTDVALVLDAVYRIVRGVIQQSLSLLEQPPIAWLLFLVIWVAVWVIGLGS